MSSCLLPVIYTAVQNERISLAVELARLDALRDTCGAVVQFIGRVRSDKSTDSEDATKLTSLKLEHYPGMTEHALHELAEQILARFDLHGIVIVHRVGQLLPGEDIVLVATASPHRKAALQAVDFAMDHIKSTVPFWKRESFGSQHHWVKAKDSDAAALLNWL